MQRQPQQQQQQDAFHPKENTIISNDNNNYNNKKNNYLVVWNSLLAGSVAGIASTILFHPLDVVRTKIQSNRSGGAGVLKCLVDTYKSGGLYTGISMPLAAQALYKSTVFTTNNVFKTTLLQYKQQQQHGQHGHVDVKLNWMEIFAGGCLGGMVNAALFVTPVEFVRNQLIIQHSTASNPTTPTSTNVAATATTKSTSTSSILARHGYTAASQQGPWKVIRTTLTKNGISGMWRGMGLTMMRDGVGCGCYFVTFSILGGAPLLLSGAGAGLAYWAAAMPLDTLKTRVQSGLARNAWDAFQQNRWLFRGWQVALGRGAPSAAVTLSSYEFVYSRLS